MASPIHTDISRLLVMLAATGKNYDIEKIQRAFEYANALHEGQRRASGEAYISHPIAVAEIVGSLELDTDSICAALLHDTVEDCAEKTNLKEIEKKFGKVNYCIANCGEWELHYYQDERIFDWSEARDFQADVVVIRIGENIWQAKEKFKAHPIAPHYAKMVDYFCSNPNAKVVLTDLFWCNEEIDSAIRAVAKEKNYPLVSLNDLGECDENMAIGQFWNEGVAIHPNDQGMRKIAERIVEKIL